METFLKIAAGSIVAVILIVTLKNKTPEISLIVSIFSCAVFFLLSMDELHTCFSFIQDVCQQGELKNSSITAVINVCGICFFSQIISGFCNQAGEGNIGKTVELCGNAVAVCAMLPLINSVFELIQGLLGG